jgi:hypothetical protein
MAVLSLTACSEDGSVDLPSPTASPTRTDLPSRTESLPSPTRTPSRGESDEPTRSPGGTSSPTEDEFPSEPASESARPTRTTAPPTPSASETATTATASVTVTATVSPTPTPSPSPTPSPDAAEDSDAAEDGGNPTWVWWLLAGAGLAALVAAFLVPRSRRRKAWQAELAAAEVEATWFARELLPQLQQVHSRDELAGAWQVSALRVVATEDQLTGLEPTAPDEVDRARVLELRDAVRDARRGVEALVVSGEATALARDLGAIAARLSDTLSPPTPTP